MLYDLQITVNLLDFLLLGINIERAYQEASLDDLLSKEHLSQGDSLVASEVVSETLSQGGQRVLNVAEGLLSEALCDKFRLHLVKLL